MSTQYYTKQQVDELATIIGIRIKNHKGSNIEPATGIESFLNALDGIEPSVDPTQYLNVSMVNPVYTPINPGPIILT